MAGHSREEMKAANDRPAVLADDLHCPACGHSLRRLGLARLAQCPAHGLFRIKVKEKTTP